MSSTSYSIWFVVNRTAVGLAIFNLQYIFTSGPDDSDQEAGESSFEEREEEDLDVEEVGDSRDSGGCEARPQDEEEEDQIDVNEDEEEEAAEQS